MNSLAQPHRKGSLNVQEMCKKFENAPRRNSSPESDSQSPKRSLPISSHPALRCPSQAPGLPQPRLETQWSKAKTQHQELIQKRQLEKQNLQKYSPENNGPQLLKPSPPPHKPSLILHKSVPNGSSRPTSTQQTTPNNLVMQRMMVFEHGTPSTHIKPLVYSNGKTTPVSNGKAVPSRSSVSTAFQCSNSSYFAKNPTYEELPAPSKPPRTFAHNRYIENRTMQPITPNLLHMGNAGFSRNPMIPDEPRLLPNGNTPKGIPPHTENPCIRHPKLSPNSKPVFIDLTATTLSPPKNYGTLKRSFSEEHVYADPYDTIYAQRQLRNADRAQHDYSKPYEGTNDIGNLHYMSSPVMNLNNRSNQSQSPHTLKPNQSSKPGKSSTPNVRDMINNTVVQLWKKLYSGGSSDGIDSDFSEDVTGDSGSEVSVKDVQERIIYVRSLKKKLLGRSLSENSDRLFDGLAVACLTPARKDAAPKPRLIFQCPMEVETLYQHTMLPYMCFPDAGTIKASTSYRSETFLFSIDDEKGCKTFGYCLRLLGSTPASSTSAYISLPAVICLLTSRNAAAFYLKVLSEIEKHLLLPEPAFRKYISLLYQVKVPFPGDKLSLPDFTEVGIESTLSITRPGDNRIVNGNLTLLLQRLEVELLLKVMSSLLLERRVLLVSSQSSTLFKCMTGIVSLLYPLSWQHSCLPVLPTCLLHQCLVSSPYLHGVLSSAVHKILDMLKDKVLIIDLDQGQVLREVGDEHTILPTRVSKAVKYALSLAQNMTDPTEMMRDLMIAESVVRMFVELLGHCEQHIVENPPQTYTFVRDSFCKAPSSRSIQMFLQWFSETQMFDAFVEERLQLRRTQLIRSQPGFAIPLGLFDRRLQEYYNQQTHSSHRLRENVRGLGKKVRTFGEKLKKAF